MNLFQTIFDFPENGKFVNPLLFSKARSHQSSISIIKAVLATENLRELMFSNFSTGSVSFVRSNNLILAYFLLKIISISSAPFNFHSKRLNQTYHCFFAKKIMNSRHLINCAGYMFNNKRPCCSSIILLSIILASYMMSVLSFPAIF